MPYKRGDSKFYWIKYAVNGHVYRESTGQTSKRVAKQIEAARQTEVALAQAGIGVSASPKAVPTLREFAPDFTRTIETECADKPDTVSFYKAKLSYILRDPIMADCRLNEIDEAVIAAYKQRRTKTVSRRGTLLSPGSVNKELATLSRLLNMAESWKILTHVPRLRRLRGEHEREFVLSFAQEGRYLAAVSGDLKDIAVLMLDTGLRKGEVFKLAVSDVHLTPAEGARFGFLHVRNKNSKNSRGRNVPLTSRVSQMLESRTAVEGLVFHRPDGTCLAPSTIGGQQQCVRKLLKLDKEFVLHSFRHTFGTRLGESGADAFTIMKLMGHTNIRTSQRYVHPTPETVESAVSRLEAMNERKRKL